MTAYPSFAMTSDVHQMIEQFDFQVVGMIVVFACLSFLAIVITISGIIAVSVKNKKQAKAVAAPAAVAVAKPAAQAAPQTAAPVQDLSPELLAVIAAAVSTALEGASHRIVDIKQSAYSGYSISGRTEIFASHKIIPARKG